MSDPTVTTDSRALDEADGVAALFEAEGPRLLGYFLRRTSNREDAADLVSEAGLVLWRRAADLPAEPERARMWLYGIARNVLATHRRGHVRRLQLADRLREELAVTAPSPDPRVDEMRDAIERLPHREQEVIGLVHWEGFTVPEAASILGVSTGAAAMRYQRARKRLRAALG